MSTAVQPVPIVTETPLAVVVVDSSRQLRAMMARTVTGSGLSVAVVHQVADGEKAWELMHRQHIDVVVCDPDMVGWDAEHLMAAMRAEAGLVPSCIVVATPDVTVPRCVRLRDAGAQIVHKPFHREELEQAVKRGLSGCVPPRDKGTPPCAP